MNIQEYQAADLLRNAGIPVPPGKVIDRAEEAGEAFGRVGPRAVVKAQVLSGGRGKAGGVAVVESAEAAVKEARRILSLTIKGFPVKKLLVSRAAAVAAEYYLGMTIDRAAGEAVLILSAEGGVEIEELAASAPEKIIKVPLALDTQGDAGRLDMLGRVFTDPGVEKQAQKITEALIRLFREKDCTLAEINPLALDVEGNLVALDAKINIDDNALFIHPDLAALKEDETPSERYAREGGVSFVDLDGAIGCIVNGAGLAMATMDAVLHFGARPANFLDVGGSSNPRKMVRALEILTGNPRVTAVLVNIFGGITRCDDVARGILLAAEEVGLDIPLVIRLTGTNEAEGRDLLEKAGYSVLGDMAEAVQKAVSAAGGGA